MEDSSSAKPSKPKVGYGNPPEHTCFKKGQSGNPHGRPKGTQNLATVLERILREPVTIRENGRKKTMSKLEFALQQLAQKATEGNLRALQQLITLTRSAEERTPQDQDDARMGEVDQKVLQRILQRVENKTNKPEEEDGGSDT